MKANLSIMKITKDSNFDFSHGNFMLNDIISLLQSSTIKFPLTVVCINSFDASTQLEKEKILKDVISLFENRLDNEKIVICTTAYISSIEFPEDKYQLTEHEANAEKKLLIPVNEILKRESSLLDSLGFLDINNYVNYEYKRAYILNNEIGMKVKKKFDFEISKSSNKRRDNNG